MKRPTLPTVLRAAALLLAAASAGTWLATGAHCGWTQTSTVEVQHDEITGIDYPVRRPGFVAGVEIPATGLAAGAVLAALSFVRIRRPLPQPRHA